MLDVSDFVRLMVDPVRIAVLGCIASGTVDSGTVAAQLGIPVRLVNDAKGRLMVAGLVEDGKVNETLLRHIAKSLPRRPDASDEIVAGPWNSEEQATLNTFFSGGRLVSIPTHRAKRLVILERLAQEFVPGTRYHERDVNFSLQLFHPDCASLRRYLVDERFMAREDGVYWRTGGRHF